jgi:hypothetical protein
VSIVTFYLALTLGAPTASSALSVGRILDRYEIGRTSIKQVLGACRVEYSRAALRKESGDGGAVALTTRLTGNGCIVWRSGALGGWDTITSILIDRSGNACARRLACSVASQEALQWLQVLEQSKKNKWRETRPGELLLEEQLEQPPQRLKSTIRHTFDSLKAISKDGRCASLERVVLIEVEHNP